MDVVIETDQLLLRLFTAEDTALLYELNLDPDVIRYTLDPITDLEHAQQVFEQVILPQYVLYNFGCWAVHLKPGHKFIGWCGFKYVPARNEIDHAIGLLYLPGERVVPPMWPGPVSNTGLKN